MINKYSWKKKKNINNTGKAEENSEKKEYI